MWKDKENPTLKKNKELPPIPEKIYFTIGEVSRLCFLPTHILRYWEREFNAFFSIKRRANRRYYQVKDIVLIRKIRQLLYGEGYTLEGARQQLLKINDDHPPQWNQAQVREAVTLLEKVLLDLLP